MRYDLRPMTYFDRLAMVFVGVGSFAGCPADPADPAGEGTTQTSGTAAPSESTDTPTAESTATPDGTGVPSTGVVDSTSTASTTTASDSTSDSESDSGSSSTGAIGDGECAVHGDCVSGYCREFSDAPPDETALCQAAPPGGTTRMTGTVRDLATLQAVPNVAVRVVAAIQAASNPAAAPALASDDSDAAGQFDTTSARPISAALGVVALADTPGHYLTATGVAAPSVEGTYPAGNTVHDVWVISNATLDEWNAVLDNDNAIPNEALPVGANGGAVVVVRDAITGEAIAGATAQSTSKDSDALIRYPSADGASLGPATDDNGVILIVNLALAEQFVVDTGSGEGTISAASALGTVFVTQVLAE